jgi:hypothetical protein
MGSIEGSGLCGLWSCVGELYELLLRNDSSVLYWIMWFAGWRSEVRSIVQSKRRHMSTSKFDWALAIFGMSVRTCMHA